MSQKTTSEGKIQGENRLIPIPLKQQNGPNVGPKRRKMIQTAIMKYFFDSKLVTGSFSRRVGRGELILEWMLRR
jgi:hypothetical protein